MRISKKSMIKILFIILITLLQVFLLCSNALAVDVIDPQFYNPGLTSDVNDANKLKDMANIIIGALQIIGTVLSVAVLAVLGIKYMMGSVEERAEYKKTLRPYLIGAIMVFGITNILAIVAEIAKKLQILS